VPEADDLDAVFTFVSAVEAPLGPEDVAAGWTENARAGVVAAMQRVESDLRAGWGGDAEYASHHLVRVLDHWGIAAFSEGRLLRLAAAAQTALIRLRETRVTP